MASQTHQEGLGDQKDSEEELSLSTLCAHGGIPRRKQLEEGKGLEAEKPQRTFPKSHSTPIWQASVYEFDSVSESIGAFVPGGYGYRRFAHPNGNELSEAVAKLEGAECGFATSSGMGAIASVILSLSNPGDVVIAPLDPYGGTFALLQKDAVRFQIQVVLDNIRDLRILEGLLQNAARSPPHGAGNGGRYDDSSAPPANGSSSGHEKSQSPNVIVFIETISNPLLEEADVAATAELCHRFGAKLVVDNTFATTLRVKPIQLGADVVIHSVTKFIGGHSDLLAGVIVGSFRYILPASLLASRMGLIVAPMDAWLAVRGLSTLHVRLERSWASAAEISRRLKTHEKVLSVRSLDRCSMVSFEIVGGFEGVDRWVSSLKMISLCPSLGGTTTTVSHPASSSHVSLSKEERELAGILDGLIRLSVGLESVDDIWKDLVHGFDSI